MKKPCSSTDQLQQFLYTSNTQLNESERKRVKKEQRNRQGNHQAPVTKEQWIVKKAEK